MEHRDVFLIEVILDYCNQILKSTEGMSYDDFSNNLDVRDACALRVLQIGENAGHLSEQFKSNYNQVSWHEIVGLRNVIAHEYGDVDDEVLWEIVSMDIPKLKNYCAGIIGKQ